MEENMFPRAGVRAQLEKMVRVKQYTDGGDAISEANGKRQESLTGTFSLPVYAIVSPEGKLLHLKKDWERDEAKFVQFLQQGTTR